MITKVGTSSSDALQCTAGYQVYGMGGNDLLMAQSKLTSTETDGQALLGGSGDDTYSIPKNSYSLILDAAGNDTLAIQAPYHAGTSWSGFTVNHQNLLMAYAPSNIAIAILDYGNPAHQIETIQFQNVAFTWTDFMRQFAACPDYSSAFAPQIANPIMAAQNMMSSISNNLLAAENAAFGFNEAFYDLMNPDVANAIDANAFAGFTGAQHFRDNGIHEGRRPNLAYDQDYYLSHNPDVAQAVAAGVITGYDHFVNNGQFEGRQGSAEFNANSYLAANPDVAAVVATGAMTAFQHYAQYGQYEGRAITPEVGLVGQADAMPVDMA